jgi:hypothetical protein
MPSSVCGTLSHTTQNISSFYTASAKNRRSPGSFKPINYDICVLVGRKYGIENHRDPPVVDNHCQALRQRQILYG